MYLTHTFTSRETLSLAHTWLTRLGFHPRHSTCGMPRIIVVDELNRLAAARMLINAAENADPKGFPGLWDQPTLDYPTGDALHQDRSSEAHEPHHSVLGWHPVP
jgi:hypothetical protein